MNFNYKEIQTEQFIKVSEIFDISVSIFRNYLNCFGAFLGNEIIGILLLIRGDEDTIRIRFFQVLPLFRCNNIGSVLLKLAKEYAVSIHSKKIIATYNDAENDIERCSRFFHKNNWTIGRYTHTRVRLKKEGFEKNFISKFFSTENSVFNNEIRFLFYTELSEEKKNHIKEQSEQMLSNGLLPFNALDLMIKDLSIFAFFNQTLIAWSVADFVKYNEVSIRNTFVINEFRNSGLGMYLWYLIFCKASENRDFDSITQISFDFQKDDNRLNRLYMLLFGKILEKSIDYYISEKMI
ncbi:MAG: GNAT family N-acetyltransferase [Dysgonamonadaceae bacterium]|jgi:GNAT superfamily N-acetyltransferase|nr:GNAT family N-acetyltransferase [Dysgonamonadaceae bacterium]